ncbi:MAG: hypothetical protein FJ000_03560, partial [Actinobacteria bacterium]|nr:hypothetical protein [Actinomycetota bacterium]
MLTYPGGNARDEAAPGYAPALNFFSDLGATRSYGGAVNWISLGLFGAALAFVGVALIVLGCGIVRLGHRRRPERWALLPAPVFAGVAGACFIGIAATPWDIALTPHMVFVTLGFLAVTLFSVSLLTLQLVQRWSAAFWVPNAACVVVLITYEVVMCVYASTTLPEGLEVQVIGQKVVVYASTVNLAWQAVGVLKRRPARSARRERSAQPDR